MDRDVREAVRYYTLAANLGHAEAKVNLASYYEQGSEVVERYVVVAIVLGSARPAALLTARPAFLFPASDVRRAVQLYLEAAEAGNAAAQYALAGTPSLVLALAPPLALRSARVLC